MHAREIRAGMAEEARAALEEQRAELESERVAFAAARAAVEKQRVAMENEARARGASEAKVQERVGALLEVATDKFGPLPGWAVGRIGQATPDQLRKWLIRTITAGNLHEVLD